jgi:DNA-binding NtrC family response regulator
MMSRTKVLSVGQCGFDSASIERLFEQEFSADVESVDSPREAVERLKSGQFQLVLVNRRLDGDGSSGIELLDRLQAASPEVPKMLISDRADAQAEAVAKGALPGFGKAELRARETAEKIRAALGQRDDAAEPR